MHRLRRWYNQNKKTIWKVTGIVVFLIGIIQLLNYFAGQNNVKLQTNEEYTNFTTINKQYTDLSVDTDKSVLTQETISKTQTDSLSIVNDFFKYCNEGKISEAYNLLTNECKELMYASLNDFRKSYYNQVFNGEKKNISLENWTGNIYKVKITDDILASGKYDESKNRQDYITIKEEYSNYRLNINNYIGRKQVNKSSTSENIEINILNRDIFMDYETYTFKIKNNNDKPILLDNLSDINSMYIESSNGKKFPAYTNEIALSQLYLRAGESKNVKIKYYSRYSSEKQIKEIVFSKVILNYDKSIKLENGVLSYSMIKAAL